MIGASGKSPQHGRVIHAASRHQVRIVAVQRRQNEQTNKNRKAESILDEGDVGDMRRVARALLELSLENNKE